MKKWTRGFFGILSLALLGAFIVAPVRVAAGEVQFTLKVEIPILQGANPNDRPLLYAPGIASPGSSVRHWDPTATPNLLMEPNFFNALPLGQLDLTTPALLDLGWQPGTSSFTIIDPDQTGTGFTDPTPFPGAPGNAAATLGEARQNLVAAMMDIWGNTLQSTVGIDVQVSWQPLDCEFNSAFLSAEFVPIIFVGPGLPQRNTLYVSALAEAISGFDLTGDPAADGYSDINIIINSLIDQGCTGTASGFYYGLDGQVPPDRIDLAPVILHQLAHGLGFSTFTNLTTGEFVAGTPAIFDHFVMDGTIGRTWVQMSPQERVTSATNEKNLYWEGSAVLDQIVSVLEPGTPILTGIPESPPLIVTPAEFGAPLTEMGITAGLTCAYDEQQVSGPFDPQLPSPRDACDTLLNPGDLAGRLVIVDRGNCSFVQKAANMEAAGAAAVLIANYLDTGLEELLGAGEIGIPVVGLSLRQGELLRSFACPTPPPADLTFAQWLNGDFNGQSNSVRLIFRNQSSVAETGTISFFNPSGDLVAPAGTVEPIPFEVPSFGTFELETSGTGMLQSGVVEVRSDQGPFSSLLGTEIFRVLGKPVSVPNSELSRGHQIYVSVNDSENTGMALFNPDFERWTRIFLALYDSEGELVGLTVLDLGPRQQVIGFVNEPDFFAAELSGFAEGFKGTLDAISDFGPEFAMLGLIQQADGSLIATETTPF